MRVSKYLISFTLLVVIPILLFGCDEKVTQPPIEVPGTPVLSPSPEVTLLPPTYTNLPIQTPSSTAEEILLPGTYDSINPVDQARLVSIPGGTFVMGASAVQGMDVCEALGLSCDPSDFADEGPEHLVSLGAYDIYQFEVTNAQYRLCVEAGICSAPTFGEFYNDPRFAQHPVVYVSWFAALAYCEWAGGRLPTEAEWEFAAGGLDGWTFPWGEEAACGFGNYSGCTEGLTSQIGAFSEGVSPWGAYDLSGNATEWVLDWYGAYPDQTVESPIGPSEGELRVARGGSWKNPILGMRTTDRTANYPDVYSSGTGFRCVVPVKNGN